jgi:hypothetical protein
MVELGGYPMNRKNGKGKSKKKRERIEIQGGMGASYLFQEALVWKVSGSARR